MSYWFIPTETTLNIRDPQGNEWEYEMSMNDRIHLAANLLKAMPAWAKRRVGEMVEEA